MATKLVDLIEKVNADDLPTNEFTIEDKDPMVILGKLNEVIANLETLNSTINSSDNKANEALQKAIQAVADATQALSVANGIDAKATQALANAIEAVGTANTALSASNTALSTANTAISTANTALSSANDALGTAVSAETKADTAITTANGAKTTAEGIDAKATNALTNSNTAINTANIANTTANEAKNTAQEALDQVITGQGTKVYRDTQLLPSLDIKPIEDDIADNTTAITALQNGKVDKVTGKQLSTEDFTTAEKNKLAGLNNYDDTQVQADITALQNNKLNINDLINKIYPIGSIYLSINNVSPSSFIGGTWEQLQEGNTLWTTTTANEGGNILTAGLPDITGTLKEAIFRKSTLNKSGVFNDTTYLGGYWDSNKGDSFQGERYQIDFKASNSNSIYGSSTTVQPPAIKLYAWKRIT